MKDKSLKRRKTGTAASSGESVSEFLTCPSCGSEVELWAIVEVTRCYACGHRFFRRETTVH